MALVLCDSCDSVVLVLLRFVLGSQEESVHRRLPARQEQHEPGHRGADRYQGVRCRQAGHEDFRSEVEIVEGGQREKGGCVIAGGLPFIFVQGCDLDVVWTLALSYLSVFDAVNRSFCQYFPLIVKNPGPTRYPNSSDMLTRW